MRAHFDRGTRRAVHLPLYGPSLASTCQRFEWGIRLRPYIRLLRWASE
jgi:hypothetical protein